jgi:hypothetical protein
MEGRQEVYKNSVFSDQFSCASKRILKIKLIKYTCNKMLFKCHHQNSVKICAFVRGRVEKSS